MAKQLQLRRGTTSQHSTFTGANGEVTIDTDKKVVVVHDGATAGGIPLAKQATVDTKVDKITSIANVLPKFNGTTGTLQNSNIINDSNGNVGIGTDSPSSRFQINGSSPSGGYLSYLNMADNTTGNFLGLKSNNTSRWFSLNYSADGSVDYEIAKIGKGLLLTAPHGLGYGTGSGGAVNQLTSKSTTVTLNKPTGTIIMNNAALAAGASVQFTVNNSIVTNADNVVLTNNWAAAYSFRVVDVNDGSFYVVVKNESAGSLSETVAFNFVIIKGANS